MESSPLNSQPPAHPAHLVHAVGLVDERFDPAMRVIENNPELPLDVLRQRFSVRCQAQEVDRHEVSLVVPGGDLRSFMLGAEQIAPRILNYGEAYGRVISALFPEDAPVETEGLALRVVGNVIGSHYRTGDEQTAAGGNNLPLRELIVAHAAFFILTGRDLFNQGIIRASDGAASFYFDGMYVRDIPESSRASYVFSSFRRPAVLQANDVPGIP